MRKGNIEKVDVLLWEMRVVQQKVKLSGQEGQANMQGLRKPVQPPWHG